MSAKQAAPPDAVAVDDVDPNEEPKKNTKSGAVQYTRNSLGQYRAVGPTVPTIDPGIYKVVATPEGIWYVPSPYSTDKLVRLPDSASDFVIDEIEKFWTLRSDFESLGLTHKRGMLMHGPPGSGKTATISFVMKQMVAEGGVVFLGSGTSPGTLAQAIADFRNIETERPCVIIFEDIDATIEQYNESDVLSILDGEHSIDGVVFIATTNYVDKLAARVKNRPSRFDIVIEIGTPGAEARKLYLKSRNLMPRWPESFIDELVSKTQGFSIAHLKELLVGVCCLKKEIDAEVDRLKKMANIKGTGTATAGFRHSSG